MDNFELFFIIFISLVIVMCCILSHYFPCPFGQTKKEGFWDKEKLQPKVWDYVMSLGGAFGLPGYWQLRPPPPPKMLTFNETLYGFRQCGTYHTVFNNNPNQELDDALVIDSN